MQEKLVMQEIPASTQAFLVSKLSSMSTIHTRIRERREFLGLSMEQLAERVGVSWQTVQQWENGKTAPKRARLDAVASAMETTVEWLSVGPAASNDVEVDAERWPFPDVPYGAVADLAPDQLKMLQGAILLALGQMGVTSLQSAARNAAAAPRPSRLRAYDDVEDPFWSPPAEPMPWEPGGKSVRSEGLAQERNLRISRASDVSAIADAGYSANDHEFMAVPELGVRLAAGKLGIENYEETKIGEIQFRRSFLESFGLPIERMSIVYADGDSMMPIIRPRGPMLFYQEEITSRHQLDPYTVYAINHGGRMIVKCIGRTREGTWLAKSINPDHAPFPLGGEDAQEVRIVGRILWSPYDLRQGVDARLLERK